MNINDYLKNEYIKYLTINGHGEKEYLEGLSFEDISKIYKTIRYSNFENYDFNTPFYIIKNVNTKKINIDDIKSIPEYDIKTRAKEIVNLIDQALDKKDERTFNKLSKELKGLLMEV